MHLPMEFGLGGGICQALWNPWPRIAGRVAWHLIKKKKKRMNFPVILCHIFLSMWIISFTVWISKAGSNVKKLNILIYDIKDFQD